MSHLTSRLLFERPMPRDPGASFRFYAKLLTHLTAKRRRVVLVGLCAPPRQAKRDRAAATGQQPAWQVYDNLSGT